MPRKYTRKPSRPVEEAVTQSFPTTRKRVTISPLNQTQKDYSQKILASDICFAIGSAGTGKSWISAQHAMLAFTEGEVDRIIICRPAVEAGGEKIGFLPGGINEKMEPWLKPIFDVFHEFWNKKTVQDMLADGRIEICPLGFMRGRSIKNTYVIGDEIQNCTPEQLLMLITRLGEGSKMVLTGDNSQKDIRNSCLDMAYNRLHRVPGISFVYFNESDVVRHKTVERILRAWSAGQAEPANDVQEDEDDQIGTLPRFLSQHAA